MPAQFIHLQTFGRQAALHRSGDKKGQPAGTTVDFVLREAEREPAACIHVDRPEAPGYLYGLTIPELRVLHDQRADVAMQVKGNRSRKVRTTQHTLLTLVLSHPAEMEDVRVQEGLQREVGAWEQSCLAFLERMYGDQLVTVLRHTDEGHPHLHAYVLPADRACRAALLHPGVKAKREAVAESLARGEDSKTANRRGDRAYRQAMRQLQDIFYEEVGIRHGLSRLGPHRRRMSRKEWLANRELEVRIAATLERAASRGQALVTKARNKAIRAEEQVSLLTAQLAEAQAALSAVRKAISLP